MGTLKYFLGLKVARGHVGLFLSQQKYTLDILLKMDMLGSKPSSFPMEPQHKLSYDADDPSPDPVVHRRLVGRPIYHKNH